MFCVTSVLLLLMVKIISQNVRGLVNFNKRREVFAYLRERGEVICIQETHSTPETENMWQSQWGSNCYWSHGTSNSRGVGILINKKSTLSVHNVIRDNAGRYIILTIVENNEVFILANIYAPNSDSPDFFRELFTCLDKLNGHKIIIGDYNLVLDTNLDRNTSACNNYKSQEAVQEYMSLHTLCDIWRVRNPNKRNYSWRRKNQKSRIDLAIIPQGLNSWVQEINMRQGIKTDHLFISLEIVPQDNARGPGIWRFNNQHLYDAEFITKINEVILRNTTNIVAQNLNPAQAWEHIKLAMIYHIKDLCRQKSKKNNEETTQLQENIEKYLDMEDPSEGDTLLYEKNVESLEYIHSSKTQSAIFRSKARWHGEGEKNTRYFYSLENARSSAKNMTEVTTDTGISLKKSNEILEELRTFYSKLYTADRNVSLELPNGDSHIKISADRQTQMEGEISVHEAGQAIKYMKKNKCPGSDGLTLEVYIVFWPLIKEYVVNALNYGYQTGELHKSARLGVISLIPKKDKDNRYITNMRPITLLNNDYKILEKILANRLKPALEEIVDQDQKGFMEGRNISVNIRRIIDLIQHTEKNNIPGAILSLDAEKCFDKIEIDSLLSVMKYFNIGESFRKWTKLCFTEAKAVVINNGYSSKEMNIERGVKQGGCCSAYYFLLIAEFLAIKIRKDSNIKGIDIGGISKMLGQYADDLDIYLWGDRHNIKEAIKLIQSFKKITGFTINIKKTSLMLIGSTKENQELNQSQFEVKTVDKLNVLGVNISNIPDDDKLMEDNIPQTIAKSQSILTNWKSRNLSLFGKINVINTLMSSLFIYKMAVLPALSSKHINQLEKIMNDFLWSSRAPKIPIHILQLSKENGGAGLVNFRLRDQALKAKWIREMEIDEMTKNLALHALRTPLGNDIWRCNIKAEDVSTVVTTHSFWRDVLLAWTHINFKKDVTTPSDIANQFLWFNSHIRIAKRPLCYDKAYNNGLKTLLQILDNNQKLKDSLTLHREFGLTIMEANSLIAAIPKKWTLTLNTHPIAVDIIDAIDNYDNFLLVNKPSRYYYQTCLKNNSAISFIYDKWKNRIQCNIDDIARAVKHIYKITNSAKLRSFQYRLLLNVIFLNDRLVHWGKAKDNLCTNCKCAKESILHFFVDCPYVKKVWSDISTYITQEWGFEITLTAENIILNNAINPPTNVINFVILVAKHTMFSLRCLNKKLDFQTIKKKIQEFEQIEFWNAKKAR